MPKFRAIVAMLTLNSFTFVRRNLTFLNLSNTDIQTWDDIDRLAKFPSLRNLRVQNWPLWEKCEATEHERRQLLIARLPQVQTLNGGGKITSEEREDAERAFIRYYLDKPEADRPERYNELISVHGKLDPLVKIDLRPEKRVKITFTYGDTSEIRPVDVYRYVKCVEFISEFDFLCKKILNKRTVRTLAINLCPVKVHKFIVDEN